MDAVRIQIIRGCDAQGQGGTVVDDASGVLGAMPNGTPILDVVVAAFGDTFGLYRYPNPDFDAEQPETEENPRTLTVSPMRNVSTQMRLWATQILADYASRVAAQQAAEQARQQAEAATAAVQIVDYTRSE